MISRLRENLFRLSVCAWLAFAPLAAARTQEAPARPQKAPSTAQQVSPEERQQVTAVIAAPTAEGKLKALTAFVDKFPGSPLRWRLVFHVGTFVSRMKEPAQKVVLAEKIVALAASGREHDFAVPILAEAYLDAGRVDDAFRSVTSVRDDGSLPLELLVRLASAAADEVRIRNVQHLEAGRADGARAIALFAADRRPPAMSPAVWKDYKAQTMPGIYQAAGLLAMHAGALDEARSHLRKAAELAPADPLNFITLGALLSGEYKQSAEQLQTMPAGPERDTQQQKTDALLDELIDVYAHAVGLAAGRPEHEATRARMSEEVRAFYRMRHNGSLDGLQELLEKYRQK